MAFVTNGSLLKELRGALGGELVFRKHGAKTVVSVKGSARKRNSALQQVYCDKFKEASRYAKSVMRDPVKSEHYRQLAKKLKKHSGYNVAISEYMLNVRLEVKRVSTAAGGERKRVVITATKKDFKVKAVGVKIVSAVGEVVAEGSANRVSARDWVYTVPAVIEDGCRLVVTAIDGLGRETCWSTSGLLS